MRRCVALPKTDRKPHAFFLRRLFYVAFEGFLVLAERRGPGKTRVERVGAGSPLPPPL